MNQLTTKEKYEDNINLNLVTSKSIWHSSVVQCPNYNTGIILKTFEILFRQEANVMSNMAFKITRLIDQINTTGFESYARTFCSINSHVCPQLVGADGLSQATGISSSDSTDTCRYQPGCKIEQNQTGRSRYGAS